MKFTRITFALSAVAGILLTTLSGIFISVIVFTFLAIVYLIYSLINRSIDIGMLILLAVFMAASFSYVGSVSSRIHKSVNYINRYVTVNGVIISSARQSESGNYQYIFRAKSISNKPGEVKTSENILLTTPLKLKCCDSVTVKGIIKDLPKQMNDIGFNSELYYKSNNIFSRIYTENISKTDKIYVFSPYMIGQKFNEHIDSIIYKYYTGDGAAILSAVLTGNKHQFSSGYDDILSATAYKRILHPAHLHVLVILSLIKLFSHIVRKQYRDLFTAMLFFTYAILQCSNIGFARCLLCSAVTIFYRLRHKSCYFPDTMATVVSLCSIITPTIIFNSAFVLSVTGGMLSWAFIPYFRKKLRFIPKFLRKTTAAMLVLSLFLTPISSYYYNGLCLYSFLSPFITGPFVLLILIISPVTFLMYELLGTAPIFGAYLNFAIKILYKIPYIINDLPFSSINIGKPSIAFIVMFVCFVFVLYYRIKSKQSAVFGLSAVTVGLMLSIVITNCMRIGTAEFTFVNVGQGDGAVIHTPFRETVIIDGGGGNAWTSYNPGKEVFTPYLGAMGINRIEVAIVSHYHQDHIEGVISTIKSIKTDYVYAPLPNDSDSDEMKKWASKLRDAAEECGTLLCYVKEDTRLTFDDGLTVDIYALKEYVRAHDENDTSLPVRVSYGEFSVFYTGDMTSFAESNIAGRFDIESHVLKVSHHGSRGSSCEEFIKAVSPDCAVISCGEDNVYSHPHNETLKRLEGCNILRTDILGDIKISSRKNGNYKVKF